MMGSEVGVAMHSSPPLWPPDSFPGAAVVAARYPTTPPPPPSEREREATIDDATIEQTSEEEAADLVGGGEGERGEGPPRDGTEASGGWPGS